MSHTTHRVSSMVFTLSNYLLFILQAVLESAKVTTDLLISDMTHRAIQATYLNGNKLYIPSY